MDSPPEAAPARFAVPLQHIDHVVHQTMPLHTTSRSPAASSSQEAYSSSSSSSSDSWASAVVSAFLAGFFFFFLFLGLELAGFASGCSRIFKTSSSVIFLSVLNDSSFGAGGPLILETPFLVMAVRVSSMIYLFQYIDSPIVVKRRQTASPSLSPTTSY